MTIVEAFQIEITFVEFRTETVEVVFYHRLTSFEKGTVETIRARGPIWRHFINYSINLIRREGCGEAVKIHVVMQHLGKVEFHLWWFSCPHTSFESLKQYRLFSSMVLYYDVIIDFQAGDEVLTVSFRGHRLEEFRILITKFNPTNSAPFLPVVFLKLK